MPEKHEMATATAQFGERRPARSTRSDRGLHDTTVRKPGGLLTKQATAKNVYGVKPGQSRRLPQSTASRNIGASQRCPRSDATTGEQRAKPTD